MEIYEQSSKNISKIKPTLLNASVFLNDGKASELCTIIIYY